MFLKKIIFKIYNSLEFYPFLIPLKDIITVTLRKVDDINKIKNLLLENREGYKQYNISVKWFNSKKPLGISGIARLKNSEDFLELVIENHLKFLDEIILVDNNSTDKTKEICLKLKEKYPDKIKFYEYPFDIKYDDNIPSNSVHSLAYYYNWAFSKSTYKYVMKVDDDNYFDVDKMQKVRDYILTEKPKRFVAFRGLNLLCKNGKLGVFDKFPYSGKYLDHGIYPVSTKTYYIMKGIYEGLQHPYLGKRVGFAFFHLKFLKKGYGLEHLPLSKKQKGLKLISETEIADISKFIHKDIDKYRKIIYQIKEYLSC